MAKTISTNDTDANLDTLLTWVAEHQEPVIVEADGTPQVVIVPFGTYAAQEAKDRQERIAALLAWAEEARRTMPPPRPAPELTPEERAALWEQLEALRREVSARNQDMTDEEIEAFADQVTREAIQSLIDRGEIPLAS